jgi:hypothetical protein
MSNPFTEEIPPTFARAIWQVFESTIRELGTGGGLTVEGLELVRTALRTGNWQINALHPSTHGPHDLLLHDVTEALAEKSGSGSALYSSDLLPDAPDDISGLAAS